MTRILVLLFIAGLSLFGEDLERIKKARLYATKCTVSTTAAVPSCAIGVPAATSSSIRFVLDAIVVNTPASGVVFGFGGTLPTTTDITANTVKRNTTDDPIAKVYSTPNSSDETKTLSFGVTASTDKTFDMTGTVLTSISGQRVAKVSGASAVTGTSTFTFLWAEMTF